VASHQPGGALGTAYGQLVEGLAALEAGGLAWVHSPALGFLTSSPAHLGTGLTVALRLRPTVLSPQEARRLAEAEGLRVRGVAGQDARLLELANSRVFGITEFQVVDGVYRAVGKLLEKDKKMTNG
jgi:protein-arginine kinase